MRNHNTGFPFFRRLLCKQAELAEDFGFSDCIDSGRGLVAQENGRVVYQCARNCEPLLLSARELEAPLADERVVSGGHTQHRLVYPRLFRCPLDLLIGGAWPAVGDVESDALVEEHDVLRHDAQLLAHRVELDVAQVLPVDADRAGGRVVEAEEQPQHSRFARTRGADDGQCAAGLHRKAQVREQLLRRVVAEAHVVELDVALSQLQWRRVWWRDHFWRRLQQLGQRVHVDGGLAHLVVHSAED
mmetsp:Transcript_28211/g.59255  ORF Transcript_28211/g.59255 Transcript_28211/m.59255 type:complete len:244 (-) Transcript_28211:1273-2004(-)|eukprot:6209041-Pleurochrysis_carterae.AAC.1